MFIQDRASERYCSYCSQKSNRKYIAIKLDELRDCIEECIHYDYDISPFVTKDASFMEDDCTYSTEDILIFHGVSDNEDIINDLVDLLSDNRWLNRKDWYGEYIPSWNDFVDAAKEISDLDEVFYVPLIESDDTISSLEILDILCHFINHLNLFTKVTKERPLFRARAGECRCLLSELGAHYKTQDSRFSQERHPMLYASFDEETAKLEILHHGIMTVGQFNLQCDSVFIDLTHEIPQHILFHKHYRDRKLREFTTFIREFTKALSKESEDEYLFYRPTQFLIHHMRKSLKLKLSSQGVIYKPASKSADNSRNIAIWSNVQLPYHKQVYSINNMINLICCKWYS